MYRKGKRDGPGWVNGEADVARAIEAYRAGTLGDDKLKILYWDGDGLAIWYKRLEQGTFQMPHVADNQKSAEIRSDELTMLLRGIDYRNVRRRKRYSLAAQLKTMSDGKRPITSEQLAKALHCSVGNSVHAVAFEDRELEERAEFRKERAAALEPDLEKVRVEIADLEKREKELRDQKLDP